MSNKKRVGIFSFSCDEGCTIYLTEIFNSKLVDWLDKIELHYFLSVKERQPIENLDISLIEGVINTEKDMKEIEVIRKNSKILIAMGTCAMTAMPSGQRNNFSEELLEEIKEDMEKFHMLPKALAVKEAVKVDDEIPGCPIIEEKFIEVFEKYL